MFAKRKQNANTRRRKRDSSSPEGDAPEISAPAKSTAKPQVNQFKTEKKEFQRVGFEQAGDLEVLSSRPTDQQLAVATVPEEVDRTKEKRDRRGKRLGPKMAPANVRQITVIDYQPSICKDYYETGFCSFGDSCKFAHIREDYKSGWQLESEWQEEQKKKRAKLMGLAVEDSDESEEESDEDDLPFACYLCRQPFVNPVVTRCKHYFCEKCALDNYATSTRCALCAESTNGVFNTAHELIKKIKERAAAAEKAEAKQRAKEEKEAKKPSEEEEED